MTVIQTQLLIASFFLISTAPVSIAKKLPEQRSQAELVELIQQDCGSCHGMTLKGGLGSPLLPKDIQNKPDEYLFTVIKHGIPEKAMPPWQAILNKNEIKTIIKLLRQGLKPP